MSTILIERVWVNYAYMGMDEGAPISETPGTLIHTMSHGIVVKVDAETVRPAAPDEIANWTGPVSPSWAVPRR